MDEPDSIMLLIGDSAVTSRIVIEIGQWNKRIYEGEMIGILSKIANYDSMFLDWMVTLVILSLESFH
jgi:hypothetical protein